MSTNKQELYELPSLFYVRKIAINDLDFLKRFVTTLKKEFADNYAVYKQHLEKQEPRAAAELVHKMKNIFIFLSMPESLKLAEKHQEHLQIGNTDFQLKFKKILETVQSFLQVN